MSQKNIKKIFRAGALFGILGVAPCCAHAVNYGKPCVSHILNPGGLYIDYRGRDENDPVSCQSFDDGTIICKYGRQGDITVSAAGRLSYFSEREGQEHYVIAEGASRLPRTEDDIRIVSRADNKAKQAEKRHWDTVVAMHDCSV